MPLLALIVAFVLVPIAELYVILKVGDTLGAPLTVAILVADSILGALLLRWQGRSTWARFIGAVQAGRIPHREILDGALVILGGALLITPGFITDVLGLGLLLPPTRAVVRGVLARVLARRAVTGFADAAIGGRRRGGSHAADGDVVEGTAWTVDGDAAPAAPHDPGDGAARGEPAAPRLER